MSPLCKTDLGSLVGDMRGIPCLLLSSFMSIGLWQKNSKQEGGVEDVYTFLKTNQEVLDLSPFP